MLTKMTPIFALLVVLSTVGQAREPKAYSDNPKFWLSRGTAVTITATSLQNFYVVCVEAPKEGIVNADYNTADYPVITLKIGQNLQMVQRRNRADGNVEDIFCIEKAGPPAPPPRM